MEDEKSLLKRDLENAKTPEDIESIAKDARELGHEDIARIAEEKLKSILTKAESVGNIPESQISQVESMGGTRGELEKRLTGKADTFIATAEERKGIADIVEKFRREKNPSEVTGETTPALNIEDKQKLQEELSKREELQELVQKCLDATVRNNEIWTAREIKNTEERRSKGLNSSYDADIQESLAPDYTFAKELGKQVMAKAKEIGLNVKDFGDRRHLLNETRSVGGLATIINENYWKISALKKQLGEKETKQDRPEFIRVWNKDSGKWEEERARY